MDPWRTRTRSLLDTSEAVESSLVELVVAVCELTEDESEIFDHMDDLLGSGRIHLTAL